MQSLNNSAQRGHWVWIFAGHNSVAGAQRRIVNSSNWFIHPKYWNNATGIPLKEEQHDIALIKIDPPFNQTTVDGLYYVLNTVCLPSKNRTNKNYENATLFGYGLYKEGKKISPHLQKGVFAIRDHCYQNRICSPAHPKYGDIYYTSTSCKVSNYPILVFTALLIK